MKTMKTMNLTGTSINGDYLDNPLSPFDSSFSTGVPTLCAKNSSISLVLRSHLFVKKQSHAIASRTATEITYNINSIKRIMLIV